MQLEILVEQWKDLYSYMGTSVIVLDRLGTGKGKVVTVNKSIICL